MGEGSPPHPRRILKTGCSGVDVLIPLVLPVLFALHFVPHYIVGVPMHSDSWIFISLAEHAGRMEGFSFPEPFKGREWDYPKGFVALLSVVSSLSKVPLHHLSGLIAGLMFVLAGIANYSIAKRLTNDATVPVLALLFTTLAISNIKMLGLFYLVPFAAGAILFLFMLHALVCERALPSLLFLSAIALTHRSTFLLASLSMFIFILVTAIRGRRLRALALGCVPGGLIVIVLVHLFMSRSSAIEAGTAAAVLFRYDRIEYLSLLEPPFLFFVILGLFFLLMRGTDAKWLPASLFLLLLSLYVVYLVSGSGFLIPYRRLCSFLVLLAPLFAAFGLYGLLEYLKRLAASRGGRIREALKAAWVVAVILLFAHAIRMNLRAHPSPLWVDRQELGLFEQFGRTHPGAHLMTGHLEAFSLPYFDLRPVITSPHHLGGNLNFNQVYFDYVDRNVPALVRFFDERTEYEYIYYPSPFKNPRFEEVMRRGDLAVYRFCREQRGNGN